MFTFQPNAFNGQTPMMGASTGMFNPQQMQQMQFQQVRIFTIPDTQRCIAFNICNSTEQEQQHRWVLMNPPNAAPLRPGTTFIDGFPKLIPRRLAVGIDHLLRYYI